MSIKIVPVVTAGAKGTRLWPPSRAAAATQLIRFLVTLLQRTLAPRSNATIYDTQEIRTCANRPREFGGIILKRPPSNV